MKPGVSPCCICGQRSTHLVGTGGGFDYTACQPHYALLWKAFDSEDPTAMEFPMCHPEGTWAGTSERWKAAGFDLGRKQDIPAWEAYVASLKVSE